MRGSDWRTELARIGAGDLRRAAKVATLEGRGLLDSRTEKALRGVEQRVGRLGEVEAAGSLLRPDAMDASRRQQRAARRLVQAVHRLDTRLDRGIARHALTYEVDQTQRRFERAVAAHDRARVGPLLAHTVSQIVDSSPYRDGRR